MKNKQLLWVAALGVVASVAISVPAFAMPMPMVSLSAGVSVGASAGAGAGSHFGVGVGMRGNTGFGIAGVVTAVNGTSFTMASHVMLHPGNPSTTTDTPTAAPIVYTVDASNAKVMKNATSSTVSAIAVGDTVVVRGAVSGTNIKASAILDGVLPGRKGPGGNGSSTFPINGNGEPVIAGNIVSISGTTLTVTNASNITYTIDASSATIIKSGTASAISNVSTGDKVIVQGTVNGTSITASSVIDQGSGTNTGAGNGTGGPSLGAHVNISILSKIGGFFKRIFGF